MKNYYLFLLAIVSISFNCLSQNTIEPLLFLEGTWKVENKDVYEVWNLDENNFLKGESFKMENGLKKVTEYLSIKSRDNKTIYTATVLNQNEGKGVNFVLNRLNDSTFLFENSKHDFPNKIIYKKLEDGKVFIEVKDNKGKGFSYSMHKVEEEPKTIPDWYLNYLKSNIGTWIADNTKNVSEQDPYIAYGIAWEWGIGKTSITARLYGVLESGVEKDFWEFRQYWDNVNRKGVIVQYGNWGVVGIGDVKQTKDGIFETIQVFSLTDGRTWDVKHIIEIEDSQFTSTAYDKDESGNWVNPKGWTWIKK